MNKIIGSVIGLILGIILLFCGFITRVKVNTYTETEAEITKIEFEAGAGDESDTYHNFVKYTVDGKEYNVEMDDKSSGYSVGDKVKIKYNPSDPGDTTTASNLLVILLFVGGALMTLGFGIYLAAGFYFAFLRKQR